MKPALANHETRASAAPVHRIVYARHGREFVGLKSPVRDWESQGGQYTK